MQPFTRLDAIAAPLPIANVDTDKILAGRFLKTITRQGLGDKLFWSLRQNPDFALNRAPWSGAAILVALDNFGCGSSREHAPWALLDFGIRCVIAPRFADIFYSNCFKNGILPIVLSHAQVDRLMALASDPERARMKVDLIGQTVASADGRVESFEIDGQRKSDLIHGVDEIGRTLGSGTKIDAFEARHRSSQSWIGSVEHTA